MSDEIAVGNGVDLMRSWQKPRFLPAAKERCPTKLPVGNGVDLMRSWQKPRFLPAAKERCPTKLPQAISSNKPRGAVAALGPGRGMNG
jgi:hypothetical protein